MMLEATAYGQCLQWDWSLIIPWVISDIIIALSYFCIPTAILIYSHQKHVKLEPVCKRVFVGIAALIMLDGLSHVVSSFGIWFPIYWLALWIRVLTAGTGFITAILLIPLATVYVPILRMVDTGKMDRAKLLDFITYQRTLDEIKDENAS
jgi:hypothetical protein